MSQRMIEKNCKQQGKCSSAVVLIIIGVFLQPKDKILK